MKKVSLMRVILCFLVLLSVVGAGLSRLTVSAQERISQEGQAQERSDAQEHKAKGDKGKVKPLICNNCDPGDDGGGGGGGGYTGDGHIWCDGWDRQGDCAFNHVNAAASAEFRRKLGDDGYDFQCFLTWFPIEINDPDSRFPIQDGNVGLISTSPLPGQVALHRWSTRKGFYYSIYNTEHGSDYIYGGIAGYVWPAGDSRGFPMYQFYSQEYGHYYTNYKREIGCQPPNVTWDDQGEMARVNWPAPFAQALRNCSSLTFPAACDPFFAERCRQQGWVFRSNDCSCNPF
jgi:hypothetical protein